MKKEIRFYVCLGLAYILMMISLWIPPVGVIAGSVLYGAIIILSIGALSIGLDISGILHEINELKRLTLEESKVANDKEE